MAAPLKPGKIITFYSYKGGTGRSMLLANVAWILASQGNRVLVLDWDLEAPGLHRYFLPFLNDKDLTSSNGVIDLVIDFAVRATERIEGSNQKLRTEDAEWVKPYANILRYASSLKWDFPAGGALDFVPAGRQGASYSTRVNSFNWRNFYDLLGGGTFLEAVKEKMRSEYDYVLIDSRTGVSDTSGICTVQMPDDLVTCFTLNNQSIEGASTVAKSVHDQRQASGLRVFPVPTRTDNAELEKRLLRLEYARDMFDSVLSHIPEQEREQYWGLVEIPYVPFYAYEEMLATFRDRPGQQVGLLAPVERLTGYLTDHRVTSLSPPQEPLSEKVLAQFTNETLFNYDLFISHAREDEEVVDALARRLSREKIGGRKLRVFRPSWEVTSGKSNSLKNQSALSRSRKTILVVSPSWVESEGSDKSILTTSSTATETGKLIPLYYRDAEVPPILKPLRFIDFRNRADFSENFEKLLEVISEQPAAVDSLPTFELALSTQSLSPPPDIGFVPRRDRDGRNLVEWLKEELMGRDLRAVVLWGPGGIGKSTLAAEAVRSLDGNANRRAIWISAEEHADPSFPNLVDDILMKLDQKDFRAHPLEQKVAQLRSLVSASTALIVLDGFEKISPKEQNRIESALIKAPPCALLITSRQRVSAARNVLLSGLSFEETTEFIGRWVKVRADNAELSPEGRKRIFDLTEGIPLALKLVLGCLNFETDPEIALARLERIGGESIERSFKLSLDSTILDRDGRITLFALSLFVPSASRQALAEVAGFRKAQARLEKALKRLRVLRLAEEPGDNARATIHDLIRALSRSHLGEDNNADPCRRRFIKYFFQYILNHAKFAAGDLEALDAERDNIFSAMSLAYEMQDWSNVLSFGKAIALPDQWLTLRGYLDETIRCCEQSLGAAGALGQSDDVITFAQQAAQARIARSEYSGASEVYERALAILREQENDEGVALVLHYLGNLSVRLGDYDIANRHYAESLELSGSDLQASAANLASMSEVAYLQGDFQGALVSLQQALVLARKGTDRGTVAACLERLGDVASKLGRLEEADQYLNESLRIFRELGSESNIASALANLGILSTQQQKFEEARRLYEESLTIEERMGNQRGIAWLLRLMGNIEYEVARFDRAQALYTRSLEISERLRDQPSVAYNLHNLARLAQRRNDLSAARQLYTESLDILRVIGDVVGTGRTLAQLGNVSETEGNLTEAAQLFREALSIFERLASPLSQQARKDLERVEGKSKETAL